MKALKNIAITNDTISVVIILFMFSTWTFDARTYDRMKMFIKQTIMKTESVESRNPLKLWGEGR